MVEYTLELDRIFRALADLTRRDILSRVRDCELSIGEIAAPYAMSLAAISKHLKVLEQAGLIVKHRRGKRQLVQIVPGALKDASDFLQEYQRLWNDRFDVLDAINRVN
jgi:DNA-binding transcriptional ArsR family regulator